MKRIKDVDDAPRGELWSSDDVLDDSTDESMDGDSVMSDDSTIEQLRIKAALEEVRFALCMKTWNNRLHLAPIKNPQTVLDVGSGQAGVWAAEFADEHPESEVFGIDEVPSRFNGENTPPNVQFETCDLDANWLPYRTYDYIHAMMTIGTVRDWPNFINQSFQRLNSGGWFEVQDIDFSIQCDDDSIPPDNPLRQWSSGIMEAGRISGQHVNACGKTAETMAEAGFVEIMRVPYRWPINSWPRERRYKRIGEEVESDFHLRVDGLTQDMFGRFLRWSDDDVMEFIPILLAEWQDRTRHGYLDLYITYGRKP